MKQTFYHLPGLDAKIVVIGNTITFLAQGNSQKKEGGKVVGYIKRNPERLALMNRLFPLLPLVHTVRYGKKNNEPARGMFKEDDLHRLRKLGKNYRFDIVTHVSPSLIDRLGIVETTGKKLPSSQIFIP
jgi:hypothetical protein